MARQWRIEYEGALYHVLSRGNEGRPIVADEKDRAAFLEILGRMAARFEVEVLAYVLMNNHYHLLLKTNRPNLSKSLQWFGVTYTRHFNLRHSRSGHLFQGRFKAFLIEDETYLLRVSCYLHRNPLRAGIVRRLVDYRWSSYPIYAYGKKRPSWLRTERILSQFSSKDKDRAYREEVRKYAGEGRSIWEEVRHGLVMGGREFIDQIKSTYLTGEPHGEIPQQRGLLRDKDAKRFLAEAGIGVKDKRERDIVIYLLWETGWYKNREIGEVFGLSYSGVSRRVKVTKDRIERDKDFKKRYQQIKAQIKM